MTFSEFIKNHLGKPRRPSIEQEPSEEQKVSKVELSAFEQDLPADVGFPKISANSDRPV
jgi:hypothetical protein